MLLVKDECIFTIHDLLYDTQNSMDHRGI
jgi:hypothetical protein